MDNENKRMRVPCSPLDYKNKDLSGPKEVIVDYSGTDNEKGEKEYHVYITDENKNMIDLTELILHRIEHSVGSDITVNIDNYGDINLNEFLSYLYQQVSKTVKLTGINDNMRYMFKSIIPDHRSLEVVDHKLGIKNYNEAADNSFPHKEGRSILWDTSTGSSSSGGGSFGGSGSGSGGSGGPNSTIDGVNSNTVYDQTILNGKAYLKASQLLRIINPTKNFKVILPTTQNTYSVVQLFIQTTNKIPQITFSDNCMWKSIANAKLYANSMHIFKFTSFNNGATWMAEANVYRYSNSDIGSTAGNEFDILGVVKE